MVIVQDDRFNTTASVTVCGLTRNETEAPLFRIAIDPSAQNCLQAPSRLMVDKLTSVPRARLGYRIGQLDGADMLRLERAMITFLGLNN